ncbi:hypothetical protein L1987_21096 [Smallanthus sonchifolius]|uniref:Uncharacterized protein n=1 Tax=Smallanthus sonchifolius TaxID=185202 RepID=A0ACB9IV51_9ASTR|nr:hypothetical protein L1987_21096 [Smallanthus sonchifolius]
MEAGFGTSMVGVVGSSFRFSSGSTVGVEGVDFGVVFGANAGIGVVFQIIGRPAVMAGNASKQYSSKRAEFMGGNLKTAFNFKEKMQSEGIYMVGNQTNVAKPGQPKKVLSVEGL